MESLFATIERAIRDEQRVLTEVQYDTVPGYPHRIGSDSHSGITDAWSRTIVMHFEILEPRKP